MPYVVAEDEKRLIVDVTRRYVLCMYRSSVLPQGACLVLQGEILFDVLVGHKSLII